VALLRLNQALRDGAALILAVDGDSHWVAIVGALADRYIMADSADNELVLSLSEGELAQRWQTPGARRGFYALALY
jgi:hypothetical protein